MTTEQKEQKEDGRPIVQVLYLNTNAEVKFHAAWSDTLQSVWDRSYKELRESRRDGDTLECQDGISLGPYLGSTLEQLREQNICHARKLQIRGAAGGAWLV